MTIIKNMKLFAMLLVLLFALSACDQGPAEEAGEKIDEAVENAGEQLEEAGDAVKDATN